MAASNADVSELLGPLIERLASELGEPIAPDLLDGLIAQHLQPGGPPPELGVAGSGQDLRGLLMSAIVATVIQAYGPEITQGRQALDQAVDNFNARIAQMVEIGERHLGDQFDSSEIRVAVQRAAEETLSRDKKERKAPGTSC